MRAVDQLGISKVEVLAEKVRAMSPPDRLRLAAGLIEHGRLDLAQALVDDISAELTALQVGGEDF